MGEGKPAEGAGSKGAGGGGGRARAVYSGAQREDQNGTIVHLNISSLNIISLTMPVLMLIFEQSFDKIIQTLVFI